MNILDTIKVTCLSLICLFTSCNKDDTYQPMLASTQLVSVKISCIDVDKKDLLLDEDFINNISIYGYESQKKLSYQIEKIGKREEKKTYLCFNADLPDIRHMKFSDDNMSGMCVSKIKLELKRQNIELHCTFKYICSDSISLGKNKIEIEKIQWSNNEIIRNNENVIGSDITICLVLDKI